VQPYPHPNPTHQSASARALLLDQQRQHLSDELAALQRRLAQAEAALGAPNLQRLQTLEKEFSSAQEEVSLVLNEMKKQKTDRVSLFHHVKFSIRSS
jgi:CHASE3 domain sensor protein